jgi:hypothetical protein
MAAWLPILKTALPYIGNIVAAALPVFTSRKGQEASAELVSRQIAELQAALTENAETVKGLAAQVAQTLTALDGSEADQARRLNSLQDSLSRCESAINLVQAQATRQDGIAAGLQNRIDQLEQQLEQSMTPVNRKARGLMLVSLLALILALVALLR